MNEKLNELAELFRQRADIDKSIVALIGEADDGSPEEEKELPVRRKKGKRRVGRYSKSNPMPEEVKEEIRRKYAEGVSQADLAEDFGVSPSTILKYLKTTPDRLTTKGASVNSFVCIHGHEFKSKLPLLDVVCPVCNTIDCKLGTLSGEVKEEVI